MGMSALSALPPPPAAQPLIDVEDVLGPAFQALAHNDSPALKTAKEELVKAQQDLDGSSVGVGQAKQAYDNQKALYDGSDGLVGKIQTMWSVIATKQGYDGALALQASCYSKYYAALTHTISTLETDLQAMLDAGADEATSASLTGILEKLKAEKAIAEKDAEAAAKTAESLGGDIPTERVLEKPTVLPDKYLKYEPGVVPHQQESANPFDPSVAERVERIGASPGQQVTAHNRMHSSIRQAQGVGQATYPASVRDVKFEPPPSEETEDAATESSSAESSSAESSSAESSSAESSSGSGTAATGLRTSDSFTLDAPSSFLHPKDGVKAQSAPTAAPARRVKAWWES